MPGPDDEGAAAVGGKHGLLGVDDKIQQHLLDLIAVGKHLRKARCQRINHNDVRHALFVGAQRERLPCDLIDVHHRPRRLPLAREGEKVAHDSGRALRLAENGLEASTDRVLEAWTLREPFGPTEDCGQRVVELVGDA